MDILHRVAKAVKETSEVRHGDHNHEALARAAIATMFNWLGEPSQTAIDAGVFGGHSDARTCRAVWSAMIAELRKEAGF